MACAGNSSEACGAGDRLSVYATAKPQPAPMPGNPGPVGKYSYRGCYTDGIGTQEMASTALVDYVSMTVARCAGLCGAAGWALFGLEYRGECCCGAAMVVNASASQADCSLTCAGNLAELCGGANWLDVYQQV
jgi:hypothetical protein